MRKTLKILILKKLDREEFYKAEETQSLLDQFLNQVEHFFRTNPTLKKAKTIHSISPVKKIQNIYLGKRESTIF